MRPISCLALVFACTLVIPLPAAASTITFETVTDGDVVTNQFPGVHFADTTVLTAGTSLNELEFPPHSGTNVVVDEGGPLSITFDTPMAMFSGFVTYQTPLTLQAFDASHALLGSATSSFFSNLALSGDAGSAPNELLQLSSVSGISSIVITGDPFGDSFVLDDVTFMPLQSQPGGPAVPEPGTLGLVLIGAGLLRKRIGRTGVGIVRLQAGLHDGPS